MKKLPLLAIVVIVLMIIGCSSDVTPSLTTPGPAPTPFPIGTFTTQIGDNRWTVEFKANGIISVIEDGVFVLTAVYNVTGDQLEWFQDSYCGQQRNTERGVYTWSFDGNMLTFNEVQDRCAYRKAVLHQIKWEKKP